MQALNSRPHRTRRAAGALGAALAISGTLVASALAAHPNDRAGMLGPGAIQAVSVVSVASKRPDDRAGSRGPGAVSPAAPTRPDDRAGSRGPGGVGPEQAALPFVTAHDGFRWGNPVLAAIVMLGGVSVAGLLALAVRRRARLAST